MRGMGTSKVPLLLVYMLTPSAGMPLEAPQSPCDKDLTDAVNTVLDGIIPSQCNPKNTSSHSAPSPSALPSPSVLPSLPATLPPAEWSQRAAPPPLPTGSLAPLPTGSLAPVPPEVLEMAEGHLKLAYAAYCPAGEVRTWTCHWCKKAPTAQVLDVIHDYAAGTQVFIAVIPQSNLIIVSFRGTTNIINWYVSGIIPLPLVAP